MIAACWFAGDIESQVKRPSEAICLVRQRPMWRQRMENNDSASTDWQRHCFCQVELAVGKSKLSTRAMRLQSFVVRTRYHLQAAVLYRCIRDRTPARDHGRGIGLCQCDATILMPVRRCYARANFAGCQVRRGRLNPNVLDRVRRNFGSHDARASHRHRIAAMVKCTEIVLRPDRTGT